MISKQLNVVLVEILFGATLRGLGAIQCCPNYKAFGSTLGVEPEVGSKLDYDLVSIVKSSKSK